MAKLKMHGITVPHRKYTAETAPRRMPAPEMVVIPMAMHIGAPCTPVVKPGDAVKIGQLIAEAGGRISAPIHASVSGTVKRIDSIIGSGGRPIPSIVIASDGKNEIYEGIAPPTVTNAVEFIAAVRSSGVVGLGGAGFPTAAKLDVNDYSRIEAVIINGAECEPYITSDTQTMLGEANLVWGGIQMLKTYLGIKRVIIGIEDNKPECIALYREKCQGETGVEVRALPAIYPQGGEKVLIYNTIGKIVPEGKLPLDVGAVVINCTTLACVARYIKTGMPLTEKCITVDGSAVKTPMNVIAPIGTPLKYLFEFCGGFKTEPRKVLYGGPMMGIALPDLAQPVLKMTNAVLAFDGDDAGQKPETSCIRCGRCIAHCPIHLMPLEIERAYKLKKYELLEQLKVNLCMECGCCSYVCPAGRPLVQVHKLSKAALREYQTQKKAESEKKNAAKAGADEKKTEVATK